MEPTRPAVTGTVVTDALAEPNPTLRWGAILAGWAMAVGIAALLYLGGAALGLSAVHFHGLDNAREHGAMGVAVWLVLTWACALFLGGMFASWFDGRDDHTIGTMHGLSVWAVALLATCLLLALGAGHGRAHVDDAKGSGTALATGSDLGLDTALLRAELRKGVRDSGASAGASPVGGSSTPDPGAAGAMEASSGPVSHGREDRDREDKDREDKEGMDAVAAALVADQPARAQALLTAETNLSDADANRIVRAAAPDAVKVKEDAKNAAVKAAKHAAAASCLLFLCALLSMLAAALGGWLGSRHVRHVYHLRTYVTRSP